MAPASTVDTLQPTGGGGAIERVDCLEILWTPDPTRCGALFELPRGTFPIGRKVDPGGLALADPMVSKHHADLAWSPVRGRYLVIDHKSSNGTWLDGARVDRELVPPGAVLRVGDTVLRLVAHARSDLAGARALAPDAHLVGRSAALRRAVAEAERAGPTTLSVLILGETGTGKELIAQLVHAGSGRAGPLKAVNCAALPRDLVESELFGHVKGAFSGADVARPGVLRAADGGTLLLDEVGELAPEVQAKLLRALETRTVRAVGSTDDVAVDLRVVAATNRALAGEVEAGRFRADLYARLAEWVIELAPLRERPDDLEPLLRSLLARHGGGRAYRLTGELFEALVRHDWPYNVRELAALVRKLVVLVPEGGDLTRDHLPAALRRAATPAIEAPTAAALDDAPTPQELRRLLEEHAGNVKAVAGFLGVDRMQVYRWLRRYGLDPAAFRT